MLRVSRIFVFGAVVLAPLACGSSDDTSNPDQGGDTGVVDDSGAADTSHADSAKSDSAPGDTKTDAPSDTAKTDGTGTDTTGTDTTGTDTTATDTIPADTTVADTTPVDAPTDGSDPCLAAGGTIGHSLCCASAGDYPNNCATGACGCSPSSSHMVKTCTCPTGQCWDGSRCVSAP